MSSLIIALPAAAAGPSTSYAYTLTQDGTRAGDHASVPAALLPAVRRGDEVVAVVPAGLMAWHAVDLPKGIGRGHPRLRPVLEGLLEDQLLDDPAQLHLALANETTADGRSWVGVCDRAWLRGHLQALEAAQRHVTRIVPEAAPDEGPLQLHAGGDGAQAQWLATGHGVEGGVRLLPLIPAAMPLLPPLPEEDLTVTAEPAVAELAERALSRKLRLATRAERMLQASRSAWDLAQLEFASSGRARSLRQLRRLLGEARHAPAWRPVRWGLALLVLVQLVGLNLWAWKEQSGLQARRQAIQNALTQTFPQVRVVIDAPVQMARELAALRQSAGAASGRDLESLLSAIGTAAPQLQGLSALEFADGQARLKGLALSAEQAAPIVERLRSLGYRASAEGNDWLIQQEVLP